MLGSGSPLIEAKSLLTTPNLSMIPNFENYYDVKITGGVYEETITLQDTELPDNAAGMRNLAQDSLHKSMVRLQYDN